MLETGTLKLEPDQLGTLFHNQGIQGSTLSTMQLLLEITVCVLCTICSVDGLLPGSSRTISSNTTKATSKNKLSFTVNSL